MVNHSAQSIPENRINFWLMTVRAATALILDGLSIAGDWPQTKQEELVVAVVHQLAMAEQEMQAVLGRDIAYALVTGESI